MSGVFFEARLMPEIPLRMPWGPIYEQNTIKKVWEPSGSSGRFWKVLGTFWKVWGSPGRSEKIWVVVVVDEH